MVAVASDYGLMESPFQVKGLLYLGTRNFFEAEVSGGFQALLARLSPPLRAFMEQPFLPGARYEAMLVPELIDVEAAVCGLVVSDYLRVRTQFQAQQDLSGIYRMMVRVAPAQVVIKRVAVVMVQMFNFGTPFVEKVDTRRARVRMVGIPDALCDWLEQCVADYGQAALTLSGATDARCEQCERIASEPLHGYPASDLALDVRWD